MVKKTTPTGTLSKPIWFWKQNKKPDNKKKCDPLPDCIFFLLSANINRVLKNYYFQIDERFHKKRLDEFLFNEFRSLSKGYLRRAVKEKNCQINGNPANSGMVLKKNDFIEIEIDANHEKGMKAEKIPLEIVFEDREIIILNKKHGILVHPTNYERNGTLLNGLTYYLNQNSDDSLFIRPHLIHRLDRETSGLILIGKNPKASATLCGHFKRNLFEKKYLAVVAGFIKEDRGEIKAPIGRDPDEKKWKIIEGEKFSHTRFRVIRRSFDKTLVELEPVTGRTNQLRIHCAFIGHPILGDGLHNSTSFPRLCLHASKLSFWHPNGKKRLNFESVLPEEIRKALKA
jgi:23S rRNA pseudouridine1911/1915/1917 synthase